MALVATGVHKRFTAKGSKDVTQALRDISISVPAGTLTALVGADGAGKSTLLRLAAGLMRADTGRLEVLGIDVAADPQAVQDRISYMPQRFGLYEDLSVQENLDLYADLHGVPRDRRAPRYARLMEMTDLGRFTDRPAGKLSGGMKQKLGLACTLVRSPELLLLDEPTVGVDPLSRRELWEIVAQLVDDEKLSVIVSTAYLDEAERCAQVFQLDQGGVLAQGTPADLRAKARGLCFVARPDPSTPARTLQARLLDAPESIIDAVPQGGEVRFIRRPDASAERLQALLGDVPVQSADERLEDGFMVILRERRQAETAAAARTAIAPKASGAPTLADPLASKPAANDEVMIEVKDLVRRFGDFTAVASTSFEVRRGEIFGLLGPNGAGKTTTFRMLCGLLPATSGFLEVAGVNLRHARAQARSRIGYVSQKFALYGNLTVNENLSFFGGAYGLRGQRLRERMHAVLSQFDLLGQEDAASGQLPGGFKQRLAMATGLLHEPEILFLDEPTSGADPLARREFWRRITALAAAGVTIIITTHFMEEAEYCDRIVIQDAGKLLAIGTPREVRAQARRGDAGTESARMSMEDAFIGIVTQAREATHKPQEVAA
ncbi:ATP-binding cassette domain-containing protein [Variovorax sp. J22P168]|uniref:ATP-binding cassette domain-containing protein n=1 Tax=Variovorax jilinensis TaxID=3053513 RepID=UPI0025753A7C|nr:ATP-binding cassette domain-containing protein [Variovorax sp. J22P168]MDM0014593.1 ATP-binding cassette domain-containing protein [Variovorax sp. J22P168]